MKRLLVLCTIILSCLFLLAGCTKHSISSTNATTVITYEGKEYTLPANPKKTAVMANSIAYMLYEIGVIPSARPISTEPLPDELEKVPTIGQTANINMESLIASKPDLVLGISSANNKYADTLKTNHIPYLILHYDGINDNIPLLKMLGTIYHKEKEATKAITKYEEQIQKVKEAIKNEPPKRVAVLFASGKSVSAETENAIGASLIKELGAIDVVAQHVTADQKNMKYIPYSMETLATDDPEFIFIVTMGKRSEIDESMKRNLTNNPAWNTLSAVQQNNVIYLPNNLFLLNPGMRTPEALAELINHLYGIQLTV